jgi:hypothetical protein
VRLIWYRFLMVVCGAFLGVAFAVPCWRYVDAMFAIRMERHADQFSMKSSLFSDIAGREMYRRGRPVIIAHAS